VARLLVLVQSGPAPPAERHRAIAVDLRGFGASTRPTSGYTIDDLAGDVVAFLLESSDTRGTAGVTVVGHSMGSFVARRVAQLAPAKVQRLVLIGSAVRAANDVLREVAEVVADLPDPVPEAFAREFQAGTIHGPVPEPFFDGLVAESRKAPAPVWREALAGGIAYDDTERLGDITVPTLVIGGDKDALFPPADQAALAAALPHARLTTYPDVGHCPNWEQPDRLVADVDRFIRQT
jgi:non-heme chloroperoxidase